MSVIGDNIRHFREMRGISQVDLGNLVGLKRSAIGNYEQGTREPGLATIHAIAQALHIDDADLLRDRSGAPYELDSPKDVGLSFAESELVDLFRALNATGRDVLLGTARGLYQNPAMREDGGSDAATTA